MRAVASPPRARSFVLGLRRGGRALDHEHRLAALQADADGDAGHRLADLGRRLGERVHQCQAKGRVQRQQQPLGCRLHIIAPHRRGAGQVLAQGVDEARDVHARDVTP